MTTGRWLRTRWTRRESWPGKEESLTRISCNAWPAATNSWITTARVRPVPQHDLGAQVARDMIEAGEYEDMVSRWAAEAWRPWENCEFFRLWQTEQKAGRDPPQAFRDRGWEL